MFRITFVWVQVIPSNYDKLSVQRKRALRSYYCCYYYYYCCCYYYYYYHHHHHHHRISHFSALAGKYSPILGCGNQQDQARWYYLQFRKFLKIEHVSRITDFCICIYVFGCKSSLFRPCDSDFGITPVYDITIGITGAVF